MLTPLYERLKKSGKLCKFTDCTQLAKIAPCKSYGACRVPIWSDEEEGCFSVLYAGMKQLDFCYYHEKFGRNGNGGNGNGDHGQT